MHTHNDLGWQMTIDEYQEKAIDRILNSSVSHLDKNPSVKFTYCNIGFLYNWLRRFPERLEQVRRVIKSGQLYIVNGGTAVHDNACSHIDDIISNYEFGRWYSKTILQTDPNIGWLIDPFGHSKTTTRMYQEMGYRSYITNRISTYLKQDLMKNKNMLYKWGRP